MSHSETAALSAAREAPPPIPLLCVRGVDVTFGPVRALQRVDFEFAVGECVAVAGHNGAGKSTLMSVLSGARRPDAGTIEVAGQRFDGGFDAREARAIGIRCVFQELSLCPNLTIEENMRAVHPQLRHFGWRRRARAIIEDQLDAIFPGHGLRGTDVVGDLTLAQQQMVEIARGFASVDAPVRLVILDEPTSSLDRYTADQLLAFIGRCAQAGVTCILITHMLEEMLRSAHRVMVMRDGKVVSTLDAAHLQKEAIIRAMGQFTDETASTTQRAQTSQAGESAFRWNVGPRRRTVIEARRGAIVGLAGLAGQGQTLALHDIYVESRKRGSNIRVAFVAGDRRADGVFIDWTIAENLDIRSLYNRDSRIWLNRAALRDLFDRWAKRIDIRGAAPTDNILALSGGNQQKVLFARALASDAELVLMDDPTRGVDIGTKLEIYRLLQAEAAKGRTFVWYTTENDEFAYCERVYVFRGGDVTRVLDASECTEQALLAASFEEARS
ncbi:monosaccharide ABC transporter ATP-binding protein (CUT2 family) [Trinickia symbiotica]|uniref:Sugar ABC transporter ATP-binding protein n=1 Tax=Trinickia symbiotica TaxID=863227 RepID=A0A2N7X0L7_9BURK|nr:sugar ABC transporter ATP-binding protein [Trinickia symbiotica]PMS35283.1 sugar ABC transporter ATP-binding protein [Trinickia symbiotica]PPK43850.1 monosaccharide ABC transporter ATP-binding protein (CUT2 family) [Trinickia symbiotica]